MISNFVERKFDGGEEAGVVGVFEGEGLVGAVELLEAEAGVAGADAFSLFVWV